FPATVGVTTYYAVPPNSTTCNFQFKIEITEINTVPTAQDIDYCVGETPVPLVATPSSQGLNLYFYTVPTGGTAQSSITPVTSTAGIFTFYVAEGVSLQCIGDRIPIVVTVHELPTAPVSSGDIIECTADPIQTLNANDAITPVSDESIVWYETNTGGTPVGAPTWNTIGSKTYFAETVNDATGCISSTRTPVELTIIDSPIVDAPADVTACDSYTLPVLTNGNYFTGSGGTGTPLFAGDLITTTQTIYVFAQTGTVPNCSAETSFLVTINLTPIVDAPADVTSCDSYTLPVLTNGN